MEIKLRARLPRLFQNVGNKIGFFQRGSWKKQGDRLEEEEEKRERKKKEGL